MANAVAEDVKEAGGQDISMQVSELMPEKYWNEEIKNNKKDDEATTIISTMLTLFHHGCIIVGLPFNVRKQSVVTGITGGSPYGALTIAGFEGDHSPTENGLRMMRYTRGRVTTIAKFLRHRC
jgi:multimeric flavodoxin WrbA